MTLDLLRAFISPWNCHLMKPGQLREPCFERLTRLKRQFERVMVAIERCAWSACVLFLTSKKTSRAALCPQLVKADAATATLGVFSCELLLQVGPTTCRGWCRRKARRCCADRDREMPHPW